MLIPLLHAGALDGSRSVPSAVLVALPNEDARDRCEATAQALRARGIPCEVAPEPRKYGRQIRYAEQRGIPFVWFPGEPDEVKDIRSGDQVPADARSWRPSENDLRPQVISQKVEQ
jgi:histidyl-tRNA synthetase